MFQIKIIADKTNIVQTRTVADGDWAMILGRHSECDIVLSGNGVSRKHARLISCNGQIFIEDQGSTAGTFLNNEKVTEMTAVKDGDIIKIADYEIVLSEESEKPVSIPVIQQPVTTAKKEIPVDFKKEFQNATVLYEPEIMALTRSIHEDILEKLNLSESALKELNKSDMRSKLESCLDRTLKERRHEIPVKIPMDLFRQALMDELIGYGPLSPLLRSPKISEIMINGPKVVFVESAGKLFNSGVRFFNEQHLISIIQRIVEPLGRHIDDASPMVDARKGDGIVFAGSCPIQKKYYCFRGYRLWENDAS